MLMPDKKTQKNQSNIQFSSLFIDRETKKKIEEHLFNVNHKISEEDLQAAITDTSLFAHAGNSPTINRG